MDIKVMTEDGAFYAYIEEEVAGHTVRMGMNTMCVGADDVEDFMGDMIDDISELNLQYAIEVDFSVDGLSDYGNAVGAKVRLTKALLNMYQLLVNEVARLTNNQPIMYFCTPYESDGMMDYRINIYKKKGYTFWQDPTDENSNCLYLLSL